MRYSAILAVAATLSLSSAQNFDNDDYPSACQTACTPVANRANSCDNQFDDDQNELNCICTAPNMNRHVLECQSCIMQNGGSSDDDNDDALDDINELLSACNFATTTTTGGPAGPTSPTGGQVGPVGPVVSVYTTTHTDDDGDLDTDVRTSTLTGAAVTGATPLPTTVITTTSTDDDGDLETDTLTVVAPTASAQTSLMTTTDMNGNTMTMTSTLAGGQATGATSQGMAAATAAPLIGAGAGVALAFLVVL